MATLHLNNPPNETISQMKFNPVHDILAVTSWDHSVTCYKYKMFPLHSIKIYNVPNNFDETDLMKQFSSTSPQKCKISKNTAIIEFNDEWDAQKALKLYNETHPNDYSFTHSNNMYAEYNKNDSSIIATTSHKRASLCCCWNQAGILNDTERNILA